MSNTDNNFANDDGGAIYSVNGTVLIRGSNVSFVSNKASNGSAIYSYAPVVEVSGSNVSFVNNSAIFGGVIYSVNGTVLIKGSDVSFVSNKASNGAVIYSVHPYSPSSSMNVGVFNAIFIDNIALLKGGAVIANNNPSTTVVNCTFLGNHILMVQALFIKIVF